MVDVMTHSLHSLQKGKKIREGLNSGVVKKEKKRKEKKKTPQLNMFVAVLTLGL